MSAALITGATAGLGAAFARTLAADGHDVVLVARDEARLESTSVALEDRFGIRAAVLVADLGTDDGCARVAARVGSVDEPVDVLVNNAGMGSYHGFGTSALVDEERMLDLNVRAVLRLTHAAVPVMRARGHGLVVNVSSVSAFVPRARAATYAAGKAWVTMFSEALALQLRGTGVTVGVVCPGFVHTEFHQRARADMSDVPDWMWLDADAVASQGLAEVRGGKPVSVPSARYKALVGAARLVPRPVLRRFMARAGR